MTARKLVAYDATLKRLNIPGLSDSYLAERPAHFNEAITSDSTIDGRDVAADGTKLDLLTVNVPVNLDALNLIAAAITVTQPVDLDAMEARINELDASVVLKGSHDFSTTLFPASTKAGESWICSVAGIADGISFAVGDRVVALVDSAPNNSYPSNWLKLDYTDAVSSVAGKIGVVTLLEEDIADLQGYLLPTAIDSLSKLNVIVGETLLTTSSIDTLIKLNAIIAETLIDDTDARLTDSRVPIAHTHSSADVIGNQPFNSGLTAFAGGGQTNAIELVPFNNVINVVATIGDSAKLPTATPGILVRAINKGTNSMNLFPGLSDKIDGNAIDIAISLAAGTGITLLAVDNEHWITV